MKKKWIKIVMPTGNAAEQRLAFSHLCKLSSPSSLVERLSKVIPVCSNAFLVCLIMSNPW